MNGSVTIDVRLFPQTSEVSFVMSLPPEDHEEPSESTARPAENRPLAGGTPRASAPAPGPFRPELHKRAVVKGSRLGGDYVRVQLPYAREFRQRGTGILEATEQALEPHTRSARVGARLKRALLGDRLATAEQINERLTKVKALAVLSSDAISSVAYGTEASIGVLVVAGVSMMRLNLIIAACIALLMVVVGTSYWQTIHAYPHGGGSYIVARDNLGDWPGLIAAAALLIDYVLTVSVSVTAGVDALVTATPRLSPLSVPLGILFILIIMVVNLRGIRESGTIFAAPTYLFISAFLIMIVTGVVHALLTSGGLFHAVPPKPVDVHKVLGWTPGTMGPLLVLTAFASGCAAMTGVEAISNGVPAFKRPEADNAARTLVWMISILVTLFLGVTYLAWRFGIEPYQSQNPTVDGQIARMLFVGPFNWMYYLIQIATLLILVLAANTSFADFPRLSSILARDGFLPHQFSFRGDRLAFTTGIVALSFLSIVLLVAFNGNTDALINLYALGVFTAFTLSQTGMVMRWRRLRDQGGPGWRRSMVINTVGAVVTGIVAIIIIFTKFDRGAWVVVLLVPILVFTFRGISRHYTKVREQTVSPTPLYAEQLHHIAIVPIGDLNRPAIQSLAYARSITPEVVAVHIATDDGDKEIIRTNWEKLVASRRESWERLTRLDNEQLRERAAKTGGAVKQSVTPMPQLVVIESPYRSMVKPLVSYIDAMRDANPTATISVVLPEYVPAHFWERILHNQTALRLKLALYYHPSVVVINVPYHLPH